MVAASKSLTALIDSLSAEHRALLPELGRLADEATASPDSLKTTLEQVAPLLGQPLDEHIANEDHELFPAYAAAGGDAGILQFFAEEHREILALRDQVVTALEDDCDTDLLCSLVEQLTDVLLSHMTREDEILFPTMREML